MTIRPIASSSRATPLPTINPERVAREAFEPTQPGALVDHLDTVAAVRLLRNDGSTQQLPVRPSPQALALAAVHYPFMARSASTAPITRPAERQALWGRPAGTAHAAAAQLNTGNSDGTSRHTATGRPGARREALRQAWDEEAWAEQAHWSERIPLPWLAAAALVMLATLFASTLWPWGFALPL